MRLVGTYILWWITLFWLWFAYQGEWNRIEWVAAAGAATLGAALATAVAALGLLSFRVPFRAVADSVNVPLQIVIDFGIITVALLRRLAGRSVAGTFITRSYRPPRGGAVAVGDRAWRSVLATYSPNAYVIDVDSGRHVVLIHDLVPHRNSEKPMP